MLYFLCFLPLLGVGTLQVGLIIPLTGRETETQGRNADFPKVTLQKREQNPALLGLIRVELTERTKMFASSFLSDPAKVT